MGDSFLPNPGFPGVPSEPSTPPPDFKNIGESLYAGVAQAAGAGGWLSGLYDILVRVATTVLGTVLTWVFKITAFLVNGLTNVEQEASVGFGVLIAATLRNLLGVVVDPSAVNIRTAGPGRQAASDAMGNAIINSLVRGATQNADGTLVPSQAAANNFLSTAMYMELNGWIEGVVADAGSYHLLERYGDLKDGISRTMGLGRMMHQAFRPVIKTLVHDPLQALLNAKYRPKVATEESIVRAFYRGVITQAQLSTLLANEGYTEQEIQWVIVDKQRHISDADVEYLISRGTWTLQNGVDYLRTQGWDDTGARYVLTVAAGKRTEKYRTEGLAVVVDAYVRGEINDAQLQSGISSLTLPTDEAALATTLAQGKRSAHITHLTLGQIETGIEQGVMSFADLQAWATRANMPAQETALLELSIQVKLNKQTSQAKAKADAAAARATAAKAKADAATAKAAAAKLQAADKGVSVAQAETLVLDGHWTFQQLSTFLANKGYGADAIDAITFLLHEKLNTAAAGAGTKATAGAALAAKGLSLAEEEKAVVAGLLSISDLHTWLTLHLYDAADANVIVELTQQALDAAKVKAAAKAAATAAAAHKSISLPELERAARLGLTTVAAYTAALQAADFDSASVALLVGLLQAQIASDRATSAARSAATAAGATRGITLAQLEQEVINGVRPIADFTAELVQLGYSAVDQRDLTALLQLKVDQNKATAAKRAAAAADLTARGISLPKAEAAVKLGVIPIATYTQLLTAQHYTPDAVQVLTNSLLAEVAKTSKAQAAATGAAAALATKQISLPQLERAVIAGLTPIADYTSTLTANGYTAAAAATLTQLLQLKADQALVAQATHTDAEGQATVKGIALGKLEQAVVAGDKTIDDYDAVLVNLGYDDVDRATLESLLQSKIDAAAAKAGGGGATA